MPQPVILLLPSGPVPVYALCLMERLKDSGVQDILIHVVQDRPLQNVGIPRNWQSPLTQDSNWQQPSVQNRNYPENATIVQLGAKTDQHTQVRKGFKIRTSFFESSTSTYFPDIARALLNDEGHCEVKVTSINIETSEFQELRGSFKIIPHSYKKSLESVIDGAIGLIAKMITQPDSAFLKPIPENAQEFNKGAVDPLNSATVAEVRKKIRSTKIRKRIQQSFFIDRWNIGIIDAPIQDVALSNNIKWDVKWLREESGRDFRADPFGINTSTGTGILYERMHHSRGRIHLLNDRLTEKAILDDISHSSYPYTFEYEGVTYFAPESSESKGVRVYPLDTTSLQPGIPIELEIDIHAVDPSIIHYNDRWWLFCTDRAHKGADTQLHIFFADELRGHWHSHRMNPVKSDIRSARPAGHLFIHDGVLYRPSQDSSLTYGGRIIINRIDELNAERFSETTINTLGPEKFTGPYGSGTHTLSAMGKKTCIDGKRSVFHPFAFQRFFP